MELELTADQKLFQPSAMSLLEKEHSLDRIQSDDRDVPFSQVKRGRS